MNEQIRPGTIVTSDQLDELIAEATMDCHDAEEQAGSLFNMIEDNLALPFATRILGVEASVTEIIIDDFGGLKAVCEHGGEQQRIDVLDLPLPSPPPAGAEWIAAYRRWAESGGYEDDDEEGEDEHEEHDAK